MSSLEQQEPRSARIPLQAEHEGLVAEREQARGLQADDGNAVLDEWREHREGPLQLAPGFLDQAGGEERPPAA